MIQIRCFSTSSTLLKSPFKRLIVEKKNKPPTVIETKKKELTPLRRDKVRSLGIAHPHQGKTKQKAEIPTLESLEESQIKNNRNLTEKIQDFSELKLLPQVRSTIINQIAKQTVLNSQNFEIPKAAKDMEVKLDIKPSKIQVITIHEMAKHLMENNLRTYTMAAETGSGKTWAYLAVLIDYLKQHELLSTDWVKKSEKSAIRSVILVPTHELVTQVYSTINDLKEPLDLNCFKWDINTSHEDLIDAFKNRIDILVTTPGKLNSMKKIRYISRPEHLLTGVKFLVVDEADTLMDRSFIEMTYEAIRNMYNVNRLIFCSATISNQFNQAITKLFRHSEPKLLVSPVLHHVPKNVKFHLIDSEISPYQGSKLKALAQTLYAIHKDGTEHNYEKRCVVFVNAKDEVEDLVLKLKTLYNHDAIGLTGNNSPEERSERISAFLNPPKPLDEVEYSAEKETVEYQTIPNSNIQIKKQVNSSKDSKKLKILVTTDISARGLNFFGVRNVILFDAPKAPVDFIHRIGRTGRMNQNGRVFVISDKKTKPWLKRIIKSNKPQAVSTSD